MEIIPPAVAALMDPLLPQEAVALMALQMVPTVPLHQEVVALVALRMVPMVPLHQEAVALVALQVVLMVHPLGNHLGSHSGPNLPVPDSVMLTQKYPQQTLVTYIL